MTMDEFPKRLNSNDLHADIEILAPKIIDLVLAHGAVLIPAQELDARKLFEIAEKIGTLVELPPEKAFGNLHQDVPAITCVTNIKKDGTIKKNHSAAEVRYPSYPIRDGPGSELVRTGSIKLGTGTEPEPLSAEPEPH